MTLNITEIKLRVDSLDPLASWQPYHVVVDEFFRPIIGVAQTAAAHAVAHAQLVPIPVIGEDEVLGRAAVGRGGQPRQLAGVVRRVGAVGTRGAVAATGQAVGAIVARPTSCARPAA